MKNELTLPENSKQRILIKKVVSSLSEAEKIELSDWAIKLFEIQKSTCSKRTKAKLALKVTKEVGIGKTTLKTLFSVAKQGGVAGKEVWNNRSLPAKIGITAAAATIAVFGTQGAGIAAFGTAIGLPLWMVTGAGAMFAATVAEEARRGNKSVDITYFVPTKEDN